MSLREMFQNPGNEYRGAPFWSWNDQLDAQELDRQIDEIERAGMGGFFIHSRSGLLTEYLSDEWMQHVRRSVEIARSRGLQAWLYDEDRWPSGFAGGEVPAMSPDYRMKMIVWRDAHEPQPDPQDGGVMAWYEATQQENQRQHWRMLEDPADAAPGTTVIRFDWLYQPKSEWCNGESYLDTLNPDAVDAFLHHTYDRYADALGDDFGTTVPGVFTDEPQYYMSNPEMRVLNTGVPYTHTVPELFAKSYGYPLTHALPGLFFNTPDHQAHRWRYRRLITQLFVQSYTRRLYDWCEAHQCDLTGHFLYEDNLVVQTASIGAAMPHYEYMQSPGIDHLGRRIAPSLLPRQLASAARQFGRRRTLCEAYGGSGWNISFAEQKWIADWLFVHGVSYMNQHLSYYSARGGRKRDYPPSIFFQQPWWPHYRHLNDYMARMGTALRSGEPVNELLVLHPIGSVWATYCPEDQRIAQRYSDSLETLTAALETIQRDHDYGDELLLERHASVDEGILRVGEAVYTVVIMPDMLTLQRSTVDLLREWLEAGGVILLTGEIPTRVNGEPADLNGLFAHPGVYRVDPRPEALRAALDRCCPAPVEVRDEADRLCPDIRIKQIATDEGPLLTLLTNLNLHQDHGTLTVTLQSTGRLELWDAQTGAITPVHSEQDEHRCTTALQLPFGPGRTHVLCIDPDAEPPRRTRPAVSTAKQIIPLGAPVSTTRLHPNALVLDTAALRAAGLSSHQRPVLEQNLVLAEHLGIRADLNNTGISLWKRERDRVTPPVTCDVELTYRFEAHTAPEGDLWLVTEHPERSAFQVNGHEVPPTSDGWWLDTGFHRLAISGTIRPGINTVTQRFQYREDLTLEPLILLGAFAVRLQPDGLTPVIWPDSPAPATGDWTSAGMPFYCGAVRYEWTLRLEKAPSNAVLRLRRYHAPLASATVNGIEAGVLAWDPWETPVSGLLRAGDNTIYIDLYTSPRNLLGPLHHTTGDPGMQGPDAFCPGPHWTPKYQLVPYGLIDLPEVVVR